MEEERMDVQSEPEERYEPRPVWQVWGARIGLVLFIIFVIYQALMLATGGLG